MRLRAARARRRIHLSRESPQAGQHVVGIGGLLAHQQLGVERQRRLQLVDRAENRLGAGALRRPLGAPGPGPLVASSVRGELRDGVVGGAHPSAGARHEAPREEGAQDAAVHVILENGARLPEEVAEEVFLCPAEPSLVRSASRGAGRVVRRTGRQRLPGPGRADETRVLRGPPLRQQRPEDPAVELVPGDSSPVADEAEKVGLTCVRGHAGTEPGAMKTVRGDDGKLRCPPVNGKDRRRSPGQSV